MKKQVMGMVLSAKTINEYDKRVVLLTREWGRISAFAKGAKRPKSPLSATTEPFCFGNFYVYQGRDSYNIEQVEVREFFPELRKDLDMLYMAMYFCEVADYFTREGMNAKEELNLLYISLKALSAPQIPMGLVRRIFEFRMLYVQGLAPRIYECMECGKKEGLHHFYVNQAGMACDDCNPGRGGYYVSDTSLYTLQRILSSPLERLYTFTVKDNILAELDRVVGAYFAANTDRKFRSLSPLDL
ncbi:MAG: DNA repair protein RecO [Eubacterium sp.]|nr:DNA repair protein RecO [Eubacterium sp.]